LSVAGREEVTGAGRVAFLDQTLYLRIGGRRQRWHAGRGNTGIEERSAEIAGQRRTELGHGAREAAIIAWQICKTARGGAISSVQKLRTARCGTIRLQRHEQRPADSGGRDETKAKQHFSG